MKNEHHTATPRGTGGRQQHWRTGVHDDHVAVATPAKHTVWDLQTCFAGQGVSRTAVKSKVCDPTGRIAAIENDHAVTGE
jgi:hypothetical protein